ncbi:C4-dicarboxylate transport sensor protein DctB [bacterium BMS3Abin02]|nr:C4-dicarboxylate transport sensor protein DctB [bacterium BMS3Abin02]GBE22796.1 C4-dicarboxylate transport sensor protein DctB [bacterium BMS3Bbin01]
MSDHTQGIKKDVAEVKFLVHDLRVERFIDEVIHFHVGLDTDLELYGIKDLDLPTGKDLLALRARAAKLRTAYNEYGDAVRGFADPSVVLAVGNEYIRSIHSLCELILHPLWSHIEEAMALLPGESRTVRSRSHYRNTIRWLCGVYYRIEHFWAELRDEDVSEVFDVAGDIEDYVRNVVYGYVTEKSSARVELEVGSLDPAVVSGNRFRFRRMYFNLIMNAVDAMADKKLGLIRIDERTDGDEIVLTVRDDGSGMTPDKVRQLLTDRETLDGELHSLGFVFVRQTVADFGGRVSIDSELGEGTTVTVRLPYMKGAAIPPRRGSFCKEYDIASVEEERAATHPSVKPVPVGRDTEGTCGYEIYSDYKQSDSEFPGCIFAIAIAEDGRLELFSHKPYERFWNIGHEDLLPMFYEATVRGRLEDDDDHNPVVILKGPQSITEYFDLKEIPADDRGAEEFTRMVHDELIRIARRLIGTGLPAALEVQVAGLSKFFPEVTEPEPFPLATLAGRRLTTEG